MRAAIRCCACCREIALLPGVPVAPIAGTHNLSLPPSQHVVYKTLTIKRLSVFFPSSAFEEATQLEGRCSRHAQVEVM